MNNLNLILKLAKTAGYLKRIKRTGWVRKGIKDAESVADHVFRTAFLCMILTREMNINYKKLIDMTLIHDLGETATSDIRYEEGKKIIASEKAKNQIEEDVFKMFFSGVEDGKYYLGLWYEFRDQTSKEAKLLKQIEKIEMALQALEYENMGFPSDLLNEFFENADKYVKDRELRNLLLTLNRERKSRKNKT
ncbi:hypothetical protein A3C98_05590 [Candidatus Roizmanbacteria bacterium RIFCSPHIGHO2_02_FULL_37_15]|uniref:5'-deoxynucleotidase n=1 Tax=Candidatus Roizmanbacteria bacterium RIFCSPLOWO2_01_FULL_37_16 TaxID=1802058 RepID=A0A1F7IPQ7_9BACT|nr:MAG: hypothetical protein A2859_03530 [Candidatus Roizmanbacteria bacterium RIFCSPHIGHO2_01_FULL_37_16b]OGK21485.1 MAG: hypothetical protein A3C98_05590 [Candidatus Roizmanbacteria bacterium RIFCSPHIGHO2_02_FULL_37_15]OGK34125.1 MAG: hypothetical protein A3F57_00555 [Candidatus Roizmanbacteria bacterium RIFCSPHIGHO2_12_FULL_36_11]OGK45355.1 MAG: hypothetical protein A3B40_03330 [Candidatus Roizmanbacteria bacterium RIFCSPLOWO2_01_FULL_37_16]OGK57656.1 MAG: hypothetical protein A3I50_03885 [C